MTKGDLMQSGTCFRNGNGHKIAAVSWLDGNEVFVDVTILDPQGHAKDIRLTGRAAIAFAEELEAIALNAEVVG
jgi:hypothetical protein